MRERERERERERTGRQTTFLFIPEGEKKPVLDQEALKTTLLSFVRRCLVFKST